MRHENLVRTTRMVQPNPFSRVERMGRQRAHEKIMMPSRFLMGLFIVMCLTCIALGFIYINILESPFQSNPNTPMSITGQNSYTEVGVELIDRYE